MFSASSKNGHSTENSHDDENVFQLKNKYLFNMKEDYLYHLSLGTGTHDLQRMFGDVKFVCMGGTAQRMETFAQHIINEIGYELPVGTHLLDLAEKSHRFALYKIGPVLSVSHGMGYGSISILLHEMMKLMHYAKCKDPIFIRIGTSGGVGIEPGTVVITEEAVDGLLRNCHDFIILGKRVSRSSALDKKLAEEIKNCSNPNDGFDTILGKTLSTDDFYEGQGRIDGAICEHEEEEKFQYLKKIYDFGVRNFEMEATVFGALTHYTGIKSADVCVTLVNRLIGDQITTPKEKILNWQLRPQMIVGRFIKQKLIELNSLKNGTNSK